MTKKIKFLEDCIFQRAILYKKDKLYAIKSEDSTHYIVPDEFDNENELSKVCSIFDYEITEEPKVTKYIKISQVNLPGLLDNNKITFNEWYEVAGEYDRWFDVRDGDGQIISLGHKLIRFEICEGHPWKHLIKKAAELAENTMDVGKHFQYQNPSDGSWWDCTNDSFPTFHTFTTYRLKPLTIKIGNREINAPEREPLQDGQRYFKPAFGNGGTLYYSAKWEEHYTDKNALKHGMVFLTKEDAIAAAEAMIELLRGDK